MVLVSIMNCEDLVLVLKPVTRVLASPSAWNALPKVIHTIADSTDFRRQLKTHYFSLVFKSVNTCCLMDLLNALCTL